MRLSVLYFYKIKRNESQSQIKLSTTSFSQEDVLNSVDFSRRTGFIWRKQVDFGIITSGVSKRVIKGSLILKFKIIVIN